MKFQATLPLMRNLLVSNCVINTIGTFKSFSKLISYGIIVACALIIVLLNSDKSLLQVCIRFHNLYSYTIMLVI